MYLVKLTRLALALAQTMAMAFGLMAWACLTGLTAKFHLQGLKDRQCAISHANQVEMFACEDDCTLLCKDESFWVVSGLGVLQESSLVRQTRLW